MFLKRINGDEADRLVECGIHIFVLISLPLSYNSLTEVSMSNVAVVFRLGQGKPPKGLHFLDLYLKDEAITDTLTYPAMIGHDDLVYLREFTL